jgi:hypothetical protein
MQYLTDLFLLDSVCEFFTKGEVGLVRTWISIKSKPMQAPALTAHGHRKWLITKTYNGDILKDYVVLVRTFDQIFTNPVGNLLQ